MRHRTIIGKLAYLTDGVREEGREYFHITVQSDGSRTLRAVCEMDNDALIRDVTYSLGPNWMPQECFVRLTQREKFVGSALFRFFDDRIESDVQTVTEGRVRQVLPIDAPLPSFGAHPSCCDTWHAKAADLRRGDPSEYLLRTATSSPLPHGGSGPIASAVNVNVKYIGEETITTPAGTFATRHFEDWFLRRTPPPPPVVVWMTGEDAIPVRLRWDLLSQTYELVELKIIEGRDAGASADSLTRMAQFQKS